MLQRKLLTGVIAPILWAITAHDTSAATIPVNCTSGSLQTAIDSAAAGDTIQVSGTCNENILIRNEKQRLTIDGLGSAIINGVNVNSPTVNLRGKGILIQGFMIKGGQDGVIINRGSNAVINNNLIQNTNGSGIIIQDLSFAVITNNIITNNPGDGIIITETGTARIGFNADSDVTPSSNTIQGNLGRGITVGNRSSARILGNAVNSNTQGGIAILRDSNAEVSGNGINANGSHGILVSENSVLRLVESPEGGIFVSANSTTAGTLNQGFGISCQTGSVIEGVIGTLNGTSGVSQLLADCVAGVLDQSPIAQADNTSTGTNAAAIFSVTGNDSDPDNDPLTVTTFTQGANGTVNCTISGICTYTPNSNFSGVDSFTYTISDGRGGFTSANATVTVTPPDPSLNPPAIDKSVATTVSKSTEFLYTGTNPVQTGVVAGTIQANRAAVLRGRVLTGEGNVLPGATITILNSPQFGQTVSRIDGMFDLAVNGGGQLTLKYSRPGYLPAQRQVNVPWQDFVVVPDVALIALDTRVTTVTANSTVMQMAQGSMQNDADGTRHVLVLMPSGTTAAMTMPDGSAQQLSVLHIRATEYTVGSNGPMAMPAVLPPLSGYTYCVELSVDEAIAAGATGVVFSQAVITYVENFLNFPVGTNVPVGFYDRTNGVWIPSPNGRIVKIVGVAGGLADVDTNGDNIADNGLGITPDERKSLASAYSVGQTLWRVPVTHFSPEDSNWPYTIPDDAKTPGDSGAGPDPNEPLQDPQCSSGSIVECENRVLGESVAIVGTPFTLNYRSDRVPGQVAMRTIRLSGASVPASLASIGLHVSVAGRNFDQSFSAIPNQQTNFVWDRVDSYGRQTIGGQTLNVKIDYNYPTMYKDPGPQPSAFNSIGGVTLGANPMRREISVSQSFTTTIGEGLTDARGIGLGGWTLNGHHSYDPQARVAHLGNGSRRRAGSLARTLTVAHVIGQSILFDVDVGPDGSRYIALPHGDLIVKVAPNGTQSIIAGNGVEGFSGDGGPATQAMLGDPTGVAVAADGSIYIAEESNFRVRKISPDGTILTVAGTGVAGFSGDGGPATQAKLTFAERVAVAPDSSLYILDGQRVRRVNNDGIINTVAGNGTVGFSGDGGLATAASLNASAVAVAPDGGFYIADFFNRRVRRVTPDGIIRTVVNYTSSLGQPVSIRPTRDGSVLIGVQFTSSQTPQVDLLRPDGSLITIAGGGPSPIQQGIPATQANLVALRGVALGPDGSVYLVRGDATDQVLCISPALPGFEGNEIRIVSADGSQMYIFDTNGRHLRTLNTLTGAVLVEFGYDGTGRLSQITEKTGGIDNVTTIQHDGNGNPTKIIGPFGQQTLLSVDANGFLASITNPAGEAVQLGSTVDGLLTSLTDARGKTSSFAYDTSGHLLHDGDPLGGSQDLVQAIDSSSSFTVTRTTGLSRTTIYKVENLVGNVQKRTITAADGTQNLSQETIDAGTTTLTNADGTVSNVQLGPDPRFGMQAPFAKSQTLTPPVGLATTFTANRTAALSNGSDPLSLTSLTETTAINGRTTTMTYTQATKTGVSTSPTGRTNSVTIDALGRLAAAQIGGLQATNVAYDSRGRIQSITRGSGLSARTTSYAYNPAGFVSAMTNPLGQVTQVNYDSAGRAISKIFPDGRVVNLGYDAAGNLTSLTPPGRPVSSFTYSDRNQLTEFTPAPASGSGPTSYTFDLDKQLTLALGPDNRAVQLGYDSGGRVNSRTYSTNGVDTGSDSFSYDSAGRISAIGADNGANLQYSYNGAFMTGIAWSGAITGDVGFTYDNSLRLDSQTVNGANSIAFTYDNDDLLITAGALTIVRSPQHGLPTATTLGSVATALTYNGFGEIDTFNATANGSPIFSHTFTYDKLGRIAHKVEFIGGVTNTYDYTYSLAGRLSAVAKDAVTTESYVYDDNGNRTSATLSGVATGATYDTQDRMLTYGVTTFSYNGAGDLQSKNNGGQITNYQYDQIGNLLSATLPSATAVTYVVDGRGRRVGKKVNNVLTKGFLYGDALRPVAELDGTGALVSRFVYGEGGTPEYLIKAGVAYRVIADQLGSVRLVVNTSTGAIEQRIDYDSFGKVVQDTNPGFQPFGFAGGLYDLDSGLVRFGARDYDPAIGRWTRKDPILFDGGDLNLYAYVGNDPVNFTDPGGLDQFDDLLDPEKRAQVFKKINGPNVCPQINCPATANRMFDYLSGNGAKAAECLTPGKKYKFESNFKPVHFSDLVDPLPGGHGSFVQVWGKRGGGESDHHFTIVNIQGKNYIIDAYGGGREPRSDIEKYFKDQGFDLGKFQIRVVEPCENGKCK